MTPHEFKTIRKALGLSAQRCAILLGMSTGRTVYSWERNERKIPGPVSRLMQLLDNGVIQLNDLEGLKD